MRNRMLLLPALGALLLAMAAITAHAEERTVVGTIVRVDAAERTLTVKDGKGVAWNYKADQDAGISLEGAVVKQDDDANEKVYGARVDPEKLLLHACYRVPTHARDLVDLLRGASPRKVVD